MADPVIGSNLPLPGVYKERQLQAEQAYQQALASLGSEERTQYQDYGFRGGVDQATGTPSFQIDPSQTFGAAQNLLRQHSSGLRSLRQQMTARGVGGKGLAAKRTNLARFMQSGEVTGLGQNFTKGLTGIQNKRVAALNQKNSEFTGAENDAMQYAIQNGLFNQAPTQGTPANEDASAYNPTYGSPTDDWRDTVGQVTPDNQYYTSGYSPGIPADQIANQLYNPNINGYDPALPAVPTAQSNLRQTISRTGKYGGGVYY